MFAYVCMYGLFLYKYVWILLICDASSLVCSLPSCMLSQVSKGCTHLTLHVLEPFMHLPCLVLHVTPFPPSRTSYLPLCTTLVKGDTVWPTAGNPTPNDLRSSWDFLLRISPNMLVGPTTSTYLALEGGPDDKMKTYISFWIFAHPSWILSHSSLHDFFVC